MIADLKKADPLTLCLDPSQMDAIYQSLTTPVSLIQGPPGTGKTHVGVKLLQLFLSLSSLPKDKSILIMAYRNGALNQFLKKCLEFCDKKYVIRVGEHSSDDYSELGELVLSNKMRSMETGGNTKLKCKLKSLSESNLAYIPTLKNETVMGGGDSEDKDALSNALDLAWKEWTKDVTSMGAVQERSTTTRETPVKESDDQNDEDNGEDLESDREVVASDDDGDGIDDVSESDVWKLTADQKRKLIIKAVRNGYVAAIQDFKDFLRRYEETRKTYESAQCETKLRILRGAKIVGITTTRAAIHQRLLNLLKAPVVLVEEAAEVLEPNLLAALNPHVKHLILIGDHLQLKPKISCKRLEKKKFDKSMFQRLIEGGFPYKLLMHQCRMRPEMVSLYAHQYSRHKEERGGQIQSNTEYCTTSPTRLLMKLITRPELHVDTQCTSSVLRSHSDYKSTIAGPSKLCIDAGFEQLNEAASSDENDEMDPDEVCLYEEIMRLMSTLDNKGNYKPFMSNVAAMAYLLAHSPRPMLCSHMAATSNMFCRICNC
ncbi:hypothetical protein EMCRGX_G006477 [Ephydatia muelleri]